MQNKLTKALLISALLMTAAACSEKSEAETETAPAISENGALETMETTETTLDAELAVSEEVVAEIEAACQDAAAQEAVPAEEVNEFVETCTLENIAALTGDAETVTDDQETATGTEQPSTGSND